MAYSDQQLQHASSATARGSSENAHTHLAHVAKSMEQAVNIMETDHSFVYPRLTPKESARLHLLESLEFIDYDADSDTELRRLRDKAWGVTR